MADDHTIVTEGLKALLAPEFEIVATVDNGRAAIKAARDFKPAVIVLDISMPLLNGIDTAREIRKFDPKIKIVFLTMHNELGYVQEAFDAGASGYVIKHSASIDLLLAIRRALLGLTYVTPGVAKNGSRCCAWPFSPRQRNPQRSSRRGNVRSCNCWLRDARPRRLQRF